MKLGTTIKFGIFWSFLQQLSNQIISFIISILLARLLEPKDFGIMGMIYLFMTFGNLLLDAGMTRSLIRSQNTSKVDYSTVFFANLVIAIGLYILLFVSAPFIAAFYKQEILINIIRVNAISFILIALSVTQNAIFSKNLKFKKLMFLSVIANSIGGIVGVVMAYNDFGVWSLVATTLTTLAVTAVLLWKLSEWKPTFIFDKIVFKKHFHYGYKLTVTNCLNAIYTNAYLVLIGKIYTPKNVGFYTRADSMRNISVYSILNAVDRVSFPLISTLQDNLQELNNVYNKLIRTIFFTITPVLIVLAILAKPLFIFLFTSKWLVAADYFQIIILSSIFFTLNSINTSVLSSLGKSEIVLKMEVLKIVFAILIIAIALKFSIQVLLWSQVVLSLIDFIIVSYFVSKIGFFSIKTHFKFIIQIILHVSSCGLLLYLFDGFLENLRVNEFVRLVAGTIIFFGIYFGIAYLFKFQILNEIKSLFKKEKTIQQ